MTDTEIKIEGVRVLAESLGEVEAERFIALMQREPFDYTKWQRNLWDKKTVHEISRMATESRKEKAAGNDRPKQKR